MEKETNKISITKLLTVSANTGILIGILKMGFNGFFQYMGLVKKFGLQDAGSVVFKAIDYPQDLFHLSLAALVYLLLGGIIGIMIGFLYLLTGSQRSILKGAYVGYFSWVFFRNFVVPIALFQPLPPLDAMTIAIVFLSHLLWGGTTGFIITKYIPFRKDVYISIG